ncbi:MAG: hypothetical protein HY763_01275 [Planctomycetes bacterium]|nr:hypothetical protein [Planctomycetota bacterium]
MSTGCTATRNAYATRRGFSITELAVVAVIVVLGVLLVAPSLEEARGRSKHALCLANLRAIAEATRVYTAEDPTAMALPVHPLEYVQDPEEPTWIGAYEWGGKAGIGAPGFVPGAGGQFYFLTSKYGTKAGFGPAARPLNKVLYPHGFRDAHPGVLEGEPNVNYDRYGAILDVQLELPPYRCPADDGPPASAHCKDWVNNPGRTSYDHFGVSYAANTFMVRDIDYCVHSNSPYRRPVSRVPSPSRTLNYEENIGRFAWTCRRERCDLQGTAPGSNPGATKSMRGWHGKSWTYTRAFVDGHADTQAIWIEGTEDRDGYAYHYYVEELEWYPPARQGCSSGYLNLSQEQLRSYYRCVIVRGDGWQKDTLPAPSIPVGTYWVSGGRASFEGCAGPTVWP